MTPSDILRIARLAEPEVPWTQDASDPSYIYDPRDGTKYEPANNSAQAFRVQCWLLKWRGRFSEFMDISPWHVGQYYVNDDGDRITAFIVMHDGTEAGLRRAITEAAKRVTA